MTSRVSRLLSFAALAASLAGCGDGGASQFLEAVWFPHCEGVDISCSTTGVGNDARGFAGGEVVGSCDLRNVGDSTILNFSASANALGNGSLQIRNLRFLNDGFSVVGDDCNVSFVEDGVPYGTGSVRDTSGRCGPAPPSELQPCQVVVDLVPEGETGIADRTPYSGQIADTGPEVRVTIQCVNVGNPNSPNSLRRSLGLAPGRELQAALVRGANCTELTP